MNPFADMYGSQTLHNNAPKTALTDSHLSLSKVSVVDAHDGVLIQKHVHLLDTFLSILLICLNTLDNLTQQKN